MKFTAPKELPAIDRKIRICIDGGFREFRVHDSRNHPMDSMVRQELRNWGWIVEEVGDRFYVVSFPNVERESIEACAAEVASEYAK